MQLRAHAITHRLWYTERMENIDGLSVCVDCASVIANNDWSFLALFEDENEAERREQEIAAGIERGYWSLTCVGDEQDDGCDQFSRRRCDCCGDSRAGARHGAVLRSFY